MTSTSDRLIRFEDFEIDPRRGELRSGGKVVPVEPQVLDLLAFLASDPGHVFSRDEIIDGVWGGRIISDSAISTRINAARQAVGDDGKSQRVIRTVPRRGFMFVPEADQDRTAAIQIVPAPSSDRPALALPGKPSIAVLPFENMSGDPEQAYFSDGITDDIITELSRYDELFVIARQSSFIYRGRDLEVTDIASQLGVRYILDGSVRKSGNQIRVTAQLVETPAGNQIWAERFDRNLDDIFEVQDEITSVIVNTLVGELTRQHHIHPSAGGAGATSAYDHMLRAMSLFYGFTPDDNVRAREEAEKAAKLSPELARAHALTAWTYAVDGSLRWVADPQASFALALDAARRAVELGDREPWAHSALGYAHIWGEQAYERGIAAFARSVALNPNSAHFRSWYSVGLCYADRSEDGLREIEHAMRLNPHYPPVYLNLHGRILFTLERYEDALVPLERLMYAMPHNPSGISLAAASYAALDRIEEARNAVAKTLVASPLFCVSEVHFAAPYKRKEHLQRFMDLLRKAGLPE
jgi:TolB-like protein